MPEFKVSLRGGFSDRNGIKPENTTMQFKSLDKRSRIAIVNTIQYLINEILDDIRITDQAANGFWRRLLSEVYQQEINYYHPYFRYRESLMEQVVGTIKNDDYDSVLTLLEYLAGELEQLSSITRHTRIRVVDRINDVFRKEYIGYRFVGNYIIPITDETELSSVDESLSIPFNKVSEHINKAILFLSDRNQPDYENSIKESISAVEAICSEIIGKSATLIEGLNHLKKHGVIIHPAMQQAFEKLYAYTSDASGIRHAGRLDGKSSTFEEAKFMLVSCSAFVNYLKSVCS